MSYIPLPRCLRFYGRDITERKKAEEALSRERDILHTIMENTGAMLVYLDRQFNFIAANSAYVNASGHTREELIGHNHFALFPNEENQAIFAQVRDTGVPVLFHDKPFVYVDQPERGVTYWDWTLIPVKDTSGQVQGLVFSLLETTQRVRTEDKLRTYERLATLGQVAGSISHEIRNPLAAIDTSVYYLRRKLVGTGEVKTLEDKVREHLERTHESVLYATEIIQSFLDLTRMKEPRPAPLDLRAITAEVISGNTIPPAVEVTQDFPDTAVMVGGEAGQLRIALRNIIDNAVQAMAGSGKLSLTIRQRDGQAELSAADTGPGIPPENLDKVFEPLFTTKAKGIGFGLSIAKLVVERHGGTIRALPTTGTGATIVIHLPLL